MMEHLPRTYLCRWVCGKRCGEVVGSSVVIFEEVKRVKIKEGWKGPWRQNLVGVNTPNDSLERFTGALEVTTKERQLRSGTSRLYRVREGTNLR